MITVFGQEDELRLAPLKCLRCKGYPRSYFLRSIFNSTYSIAGCYESELNPCAALSNRKIKHAWQTSLRPRATPSWIRE